MKNGFFLVAITAILLTSTLASQVYGQSLQITVETDKDMYSPGEAIIVSGTLNKITSNEVVQQKLEHIPSMYCMLNGQMRSR